MDKQEIINTLNELKNGGAEIAEVKVHISNAGKVIHENESLLVRLVDKPSNENFINNTEHWDLFDSIEDFKVNAYYKEGANETYCIKRSGLAAFLMMPYRWWGLLVMSSPHFLCCHSWLKPLKVM